MGAGSGEHPSSEDSLDWNIDMGTALAGGYAGAPRIWQDCPPNWRRAAYGLSWFDAHLWAYAEVHGIAEPAFEDFQHGRMYGTVTIRNPFLALSAST